MDNSELLKQLLEEQRRTNRLLEQEQREREEQKRCAQREAIAQMHGVDASQVFLGDYGTYSIARKPRQVQSVADRNAWPI